MADIHGHPYWKATFDKSGHLTGPDPRAEIAAAGLGHLFVFAHGWNNSAEDAESLFEDMFARVAEQAGTQPGLDAIGFLGIFWPSIWFPEPSPSQRAAVAEAAAAGRPGQADAAVTGADIAATLRPAYPDHGEELAALGQLIDEGLAASAAGDVPDEVQKANVEKFRSQLAALTDDPTDAALDSGETAVVYAPPGEGQDTYQKLAEVMGSTPPGSDAQGLGDLFGKVWSGAKSAMRVASYLEMKSRAGVVGRNGLGPLLVSLKTDSPHTKVHLMGHSFGARLVSFALSAIDAADKSPVASVTLIQGAFSHWAFAQADLMPYGVSGPLFGFRDRVHGPVMSTFSGHDWAVGIWYPKASFLADDLVDAAETASKWGGMGSDGAQAVPGPADAIPLEAAGHGYQLQAGAFYRFDSNDVIKTIESPFAGAHSDIRHDQVAWLSVCAAAGL